MGEEDTRRQALNVARMRLLGAEVVPVTTGSRTLKDAINEAMRDWVTNVDTTHYLLGTVAGPHPFPTMVRDFHRGHRRRGPRAGARAGRPACRTRSLACVGGGSNAIGIFHAFLDDPSVRLLRLRGRRRRRRDRAARRDDHRRRARRAARRPHLRAAGRGRPDRSSRTRSRPGLDYPGVGPEHAWLHDTGRASYRAGHRRRGDGGVPAALPHRGHHPGHRERARAGRRAARSAASSARDAVAAGQPLRPRRQGRRHRGPLVRLVADVDSPRCERDGEPAGDAWSQHERRRGLRRRAPRAGPRWSATCPVGLPERRRRGRRDGRDGRGRRRHRRDRPAVLRPADGRPGHPGRRSTARCTAGTRTRTCCARSRRSPRPAPPVAGHDLLEPGRPVRRRRVRRATSPPPAAPA